MAQLHNIDLNLLVVLDALLVEQNVGRAARRVGLSQSATSHALARLRELLGDELLVRSHGSMHPTPRALALAPELRVSLQNLAAVVFGDDDAFEPAGAGASFEIACEDYFAATVLPTLIRNCRAQAPNVELRLVELGGAVHEKVAGHRVDLAIGVVEADTPATLETEVLFVEQISCIARSDVAQPLSLETYAACDHGVVAVGAPGPTRIDRLLAERGLRRNVVVRIPHFLAAPFLVLETGMLFTCPTRLAHRFAGIRGITVLEPPAEVQFSFRYVQMWHRRVGRSAAHRWLRRQVQRAATGA